MKKQSLLIALTLMLLTSCNFNNSSNASGDTNSTSQSPSIIDSSKTSASNSTSNGASTSASNSSSSSTPAPNPAKVVDSIKDIFTLGKDLEENEIGELVQFEATYLLGIAMNNSSEDLMLFADDESYIYLRVPYAKYTGYLAKRYEMQEYQVTANITNVNNQIELTLNNSLTVQESVINLTSSISYNEENISEAKNSLLDLVDEFNAIPLNNKKYGSGKIVTITGQVIATEYKEANKKCVIYDGTNVVTVIGSSKIVGQYDIGTTIEVTGILNIQISCPAVLLLSSKVKSDVSKDLNMTNFEEVKPSYFKKWNLISDSMKTPEINDFMKLYKTTAYITNDKSRTTKGQYYVGAVDNASDKLSDNGIKTSIAGFYLMNNQNLSELEFSYSAFYGFHDKVEPVTFYFTLFSFNNNEHAWNCFPVVNYETNPNYPNSKIEYVAK